jgi:hypothetical protein
MIDEKQLINNEMKHLSKEYRTDKNKMSDLLHSDFYEVGVSGRKYCKKDILDAIPLDTSEYAIQDFSYIVKSGLITTKYILIKNKVERRSCTSVWSYEEDKLKLLSFKSIIYRK